MSNSRLTSSAWTDTLPVAVLVRSTLVAGVIVLDDRHGQMMTDLRSRVIPMEDIDQIVHQFILREFLPGEDPADLTDDTPLITGGILDSISTLKLVVFLEEHFGITIEAYEAGVEHLDSIGQISSLISKKKTAA